jgi:type IX secretion system PorP/SprF family membrane protein
MILKKYWASLSLALLVLSAVEIKAQDAQFSQNYASFTYLNPAFSGIIDNAKAGLQYRSQWKNANSLYTSSLAYGAMNFEKQKSSLSFTYLNNQEALGAYNKQDFMLGYAFALNLGENSKLILGLQSAYGSEKLDYTKLVFGDQLSQLGVSASSLENFTGVGVNNYFDFNSGLLLYGKKAFLGFTASHLTEPSYGFGNIENILERKYMTQAGIRLAVNDAETKSWLLTSMFKSQGKYDQLDLGTYLDLRYICFGVWYRGLPIVKNYSNFTNNESVIGMAGIKIKKVTAAYSYDYVISGLNSNVHEISLYYDFRIDKKEVEPKLGLPIPMF